MRLCSPCSRESTVMIVFIRSVVNSASLIPPLHECSSILIQYLQYNVCVAKEHVVGWYSTGPKLRENDLDVHGLFNE